MHDVEGCRLPILARGCRSAALLCREQHCRYVSVPDMLPNGRRYALPVLSLHLQGLPDSRDCRFFAQDMHDKQACSWSLFSFRPLSCPACQRPNVPRHMATEIYTFGPCINQAILRTCTLHAHLRPSSSIVKAAFCRPDRCLAACEMMATAALPLSADGLR